MKRIFTLSIVTLLAFAAASAQGYRKWDFTHWSAQTIANLMADAAASSTTGWSDIEKAANAGEGKTAPAETANKCFWLTDSEGGTLKANGVVIPETEGLEFNPSYTGRRSLAIAIDYPSTSLGEYGGPQYLWLGGKTQNCFTIPNVRVGQKIVITLESHKPAEARGIELYIGSVADANKLGESFTPTTIETRTWEEGWTLPEGMEPAETVDIIVYNTNGCHIYTIEVGDNSQKSKVAYLYGGDVNEDQAYQHLSLFDSYNITPVEANGALTMDLAYDYDAIIISSTVTSAEAISSLNAISPFVPTLNLNPAVYEAWGVGQTVDAGTNFAVVANPGHALYRGLTEDQLVEDPDNGQMVLVLSSNVSFQGISALAGRFVGDDVMATAMGNEEIIAIHQHNMSHNGYMYIPYTQELMNDGVSEDILKNAVVLLANTKVKVSQAPAPVFSLEYKNMNTNVTIKSGVPNAEIFYTTDGSVPTDQSTPYTEPFNLTQETTVKAVVRGEGYLMSEVAEQLVDMRPQMPQPTIALDQQDGKTIVTLAGTGADSVAVYYNYSGSLNKANSSLYVDSIPLVVNMPGRVIYAFSSADGFVDSDLASQEVIVNNPKVRIDVLAHMDANHYEYNDSSTSTSYYFSWGKNKSGENGYYYYNPETAEETVTVDPETGEETISMVYKDMNPEEEKDFGNGWMIRSRGQLTIWENGQTGTNYGDSNGYNYASVNDENPYFPVTKGYINLADKNTQPADAEFPYNAYIISTKKFQGPFDIVANVASITKPASPGTHYVVLQTSTDGNLWDSNWQTAGDTILITNSARLTHNITRSYEGTDEVYVRAYLCANNSKVGFYDIYIANAGEQSQQLLTGIEEVVESLPMIKSDAIYDLQGRRLHARPAQGIYIQGGRKYVVK
ncbi:MAG: chitobiase/beta-hexosaminidase C-terminal domain-containing protein [Prevotella sp.]|nr:chitobiase/beta-hexosaminidase C-terminal domain-containing protein [Prevotella sp.]